jgi:hypothetical protein
MIGKNEKNHTYVRKQTFFPGMNIFYLLKDAALAGIFIYSEFGTILVLSFHVTDKDGRIYMKNSN